MVAQHPGALAAHWTHQIRSLLVDPFLGLFPLLGRQFPKIVRHGRTILSCRYRLLMLLEPPDSDVLAVNKSLIKFPGFASWDVLNVGALADHERHILWNIPLLDR